MQSLMELMGIVWHLPVRKGRQTRKIEGAAAALRSTGQGERTCKMADVCVLVVAFPGSLVLIAQNIVLTKSTSVAVGGG